MDIVGIGRPCIDILTVVEKLPKPDSGSGILDFSRQGGGNVATAMVAAARLGSDVGMIGVTGSCLHGQAIRDDFAYNNVDISQIVTLDGKPNDFASGITGELNCLFASALQDILTHIRHPIWEMLVQKLEHRQAVLYFEMAK